MGKHAKTGSKPIENTIYIIQITQLEPDVSLIYCIKSFL